VVTAPAIAAPPTPASSAEPWLTSELQPAVQHRRTRPAPLASARTFGSIDLRIVGYFLSYHALEPGRSSRGSPEQNPNPHSALIPVSWISFDHLPYSARIAAAASSGVVQVAIAPWASRLSCTSGIARMPFSAS